MFDAFLYKEYFLTTHVFEVNIHTKKRMLEDWFELKVAKCPIVQVVSSEKKYPAFNFEKIGKQRSYAVFVSPITFFSVSSVQIIRECMQIMSQA